MVGAPAHVHADSSFVVVTHDGAAARDLAQTLARTLCLPYAEAGTAADAALQLVQTKDGLELREARTRTRLRVDFTAAELRGYRSGGRGPHKLRRALGADACGVVDATAGLARDAVHLACLGYRVTAIERNPIVSALAQDGLARARAAGLLPDDNPLWLTGDARLILPTLDPPPAVYLDPMFPPKRKKSAAARKEMRLLHALVGTDSDALELFAIARACATNRVVVKRPDDAAPLAPGRSADYAGKLVRYDVYRAGAV